MAKQGFIGSLFDFSFSNFVTPTIIKIIYGIALVMVVLATLGYGVMGLIMLFNDAAIQGIVLIIFGCPIMLVCGTISSRVYCELLVLSFRIIETLMQIETNTRAA